MSARPWIVLLLLINYLLVVGMGCVNRPEDQSELIQIQTSHEGHEYLQCRYLRMDGLESFLLESMASRYQNESRIPDHQLISVVSGITVHYLTHTCWQLLPPPTRLVEAPVFSYQLIASAGVRSIVNTPPWRA